MITLKEMVRRNPPAFLKDPSRICPLFCNTTKFLLMMEFAINNSVYASTAHTPSFVNGLHHPLLPTFLKCDSSRRGEGLIRANGNPALTLHVLTMRSLRSTPMSIISTLVKKMKARAKMLLLDTILIKSASRLLHPKTHSQR